MANFGWVRDLRMANFGWARDLRMATNPVGAELAREGGGSVTAMLDVLAPSRASFAPTVDFGWVRGFVYDEFRLGAGICVWRISAGHRDLCMAKNPVGHERGDRSIPQYSPSAFRQAKKNPPKRVFPKTITTPCRQRILAYGRSSMILSTPCASVDEARLRFGSKVQ